MAETSTIMGLVAAFIGIAIMLGIGIQILGNVQSSTNCNALPGFNATGKTNGTGLFGSAPTATDSKAENFKYSGWSLSCLKTNSQMSTAYTLLLITIIVIAAIAILFVIRML